MGIKQKQPKKIKLLIADDHTFVREGLRSLLENSNDVCVIGEAKNGLEAVTLTKKLRPDIILMDVSMPELSGIEASKQILKKIPATKIIMLSMHESGDYISQSLKVGAMGYLIKTASSAEILEAIRTVYKGEYYARNAVADFIIKEYTSNHTMNNSPFDILSKREKEILASFLNGHTIAQMAKIFKISPKTVSTYQKRTMQKLDVANTTSLTKMAIKHGFPH